MTEHKHVRAHVVISGWVQGVCYRAYTVDEASAAGIAGWVRNTADGRVEAVFEGEKSAVEAMIAWCHKGPSAARVSNVEVVWSEPQGEQGFGIRY
ncbi:MAG: acylphosphatase [Candidatus Methylomirabilota bacterium]|nr:acylphosphatase [Candidatus Methylomirabilis sp.]NJD67404.1 acylphosphatase [candidate division NC10 bacterium]PWB42951.1 MAG: acylphosphatase [candidate division NC10 bacterium]